MVLGIDEIYETLSIYYEMSNLNTYKNWTILDLAVKTNFGAKQNKSFLLQLIGIKYLCHG